MENHDVFVVPGLSDNETFTNFLSRNWEEKYGITKSIHLMPWMDKEEPFETKLDRLLSRIDESTANGNRVSLIGTSGGGSAVVNVICARPEINKVVNVCGRLSAGENVRPTLENAGKNSPAFIDSVILCEEKSQDLPDDIRSRIMTIYPIWDEIVPTSTMKIEGSFEVQIVGFEHILNIATAMAFHSDEMFEFLLED